jgi:hypothetical protein
MSGLLASVDILWTKHSSIKWVLQDQRIELPLALLVYHSVRILAESQVQEILFPFPLRLLWPTRRCKFWSSTLITSACYGTKIYELSSDQDSKQDMKHFVDIPTRPWSAWYIRVPIWVSIFLQRQTNKLQQGAQVEGTFHHTIIVWAGRNVNKHLACNEFRIGHLLAEEWSGIFTSNTAQANSS